jgi:hypothetical protein
MHEIISVPPAQLLLDPENPRMGETQESQHDTYRKLAEKLSDQLVALAKDIVENGLDPTTLPAVIATGDRHQRYRVLEGNRRLLAIKALETPAIVTGVLSASNQRKLAELSSEYETHPIETITCILFDSEDEAHHWVELRHTGSNQGAGLVGWDSDEQDRYRTRRGLKKKRTVGGQVLDYLKEVDGPFEAGKVVTNITRLLSTPEVRKSLGLDVIKGDVVLTHDPNEVLKVVRYIVDDFRAERAKVTDIYHVADKRRYIADLPAAVRPDLSRPLPKPVPLADVKSASRENRKRSRRPRDPAQRAAVVPSNCPVNPTHPRINAIYNELSQLNADSFPNAAAVLLRVFVELSVDHEINAISLMTEQERGSKQLAQRLRALADKMKEESRASEQLVKAVHKVADSQHTLAASTRNFNQYVHNEYVYPKPAEVRMAWDELQPFMELIWP